MPKTPEKQQELARRVANVHAESVLNKLKELKCPKKQKLELLDEIVNTIKTKSAAERDDCR